MAEDHVILRNLRKKSLKFKKGEVANIDKKQKVSSGLNGQQEISPNGALAPKLSPPDAILLRRESDNSMYATSVSRFFTL